MQEDIRKVSARQRNRIKNAAASTSSTSYTRDQVVREESRRSRAAVVNLSVRSREIKREETRACSFGATTCSKILLLIRGWREEGIFQAGDRLHCEYFTLSLCIFVYEVEREMVCRIERFDESSQSIYAMVQERFYDCLICALSLLLTRYAFSCVYKRRFDRYLRQFSSEWLIFQNVDNIWTAF